LQHNAHPPATVPEIPVLRIPMAGLWKRNKRKVVDHGTAREKKKEE
jgi:hypothetical protein